MANPQVKTFDPGIVAVWFGPTLITGFMDGTVIKASRVNKSFNMKVGVDGTATRSKSNDRSGTIEVTLQQSSMSNDILSAIMQADENFAAAGVSPSILPLLVVDNSGRTKLSALTAWISKPADVEFGHDVLGRTWIFETNDLEMAIGGN
jgi:hypothetical protein